MLPDWMLLCAGFVAGGTAAALIMLIVLLSTGRQSSTTRRRGQKMDHDLCEAKRAPVQGEYRYSIPKGTISWEEHLEAWEAYSETYGSSQSAERIAERHGFGFLELVILLGHAPETWEGDQ